MRFRFESTENFFKLILNETKLNISRLLLTYREEDNKNKIINNNEDSWVMIFNLFSCHYFSLFLVWITKVQDQTRTKGGKQENVENRS